MTFTYRDGDDYLSSSSNSAVLTAPVGVAKDDIMFTLINRDGTPGPSSSPSGWAMVPGTTNRNVGSLDYCALWYKIATASEPADYTWNWTSAEKTTIGLYGFYGDFDPSDPFQVVSDTVFQIYNSTIKAASMNVPTANSPILWFGSSYTTSEYVLSVPTTPFSMTALTQIGSASPDMYQRVGYGEWSGSGETGSMDGTISGGSTASKHAFAVALNPSFGGTRSQASCIGF